jgi:hypothetical protein
MTFERGSAAVVVLGLMGVAASLSVVTARVGAVLVDEAKADVAADAAALAGVYGGVETARRVAALNGARMVSATDDLRVGGEFVVQVQVGRAVRSAAAVDSWAQPRRTIDR